MQNIFAIIAAAGALTMPQTGIATSAPVAVSTCAISAVYTPSSIVDFGGFIPSTSSRALELTFLNTDDAIATQVTFDVTHDGTHATVTDSGRFSKGVAIEHSYDGVAGAYGSPAVCSVTAVTFADGRRWTAPV